SLRARVGHGYQLLRLTLERPSGRDYDPDRLSPRLAGVRVVRSAMVAGRAGHRPATRPQGEERLAEAPPGFALGTEFAAITRPGWQQHRTVDHNTSSLIGGRESLEVYRPKIPAEVFLRPGPNGQSEQRLRTFV